MATVTTSAAVTIPSFTGLKAANGSGSASRVCAKAAASWAAAPRRSIKASLRNAGAAAAIATAASAMLAGNAMAIEVLLGAPDGSLAFVPSNFSVASGEKIVFKNNAGFPHNIVFDESGVPEGVKADEISQEEYLNAPGETFAVTLTAKGDYSFYCEPHQGAGMVGKVTVN